MILGRRVRFQFQNSTPQQPRQTGQLVAGHACRDITPPAGLPKAGYSSNAHTGCGFRTRLKVRVVYLRDSQGQPLAFVQADLLGGSLIVRLRVLELIAPYTDIGPESLVFAATHTHAGAGQFASCNFYNRFASNKSGFDPDWFEFLAQQMSAAIIEAYRQAKPARVASGSCEVWGLTRNRSLIPHHHNVDRLIKQPLSHAKFYAINPRLSLLRIDACHDDGQYYPLAAISTFAIHGTGISQHEDEYNADVWAYIERELEQQIAHDYQTPWPVWHAAVEGTHGDVAPAIHYQAAGYIEARRVGEAIGKQATQLFRQLEPLLIADAPVRCAFRVLNVQDKKQSSLPKPAVGAALLAGAQENVTPILHKLPPFRAGSLAAKAASTDNPHGTKHKLLPAPIRQLILPAEEFPYWLPLQLIQVGSFLFAGLPFEITVAAGRRIEQAIRQVLPPEAAHYGVTVSSVCNDYFGYCTTPEEYACQYYEGGHTLYGPDSNAFLAKQMAQLTYDLQQRGSFAQQPAQWSFSFQRGRYWPKTKLSSGRRYWLAEPEFHDAEGWHESYWSVAWQDVNTSLIQWHQPLVTVEYSDDLGQTWQWYCDDQGVDLSIRWLAHVEQGMAHYQIRWFNPTFYGRRYFRFVIAARPKQEALYSSAFAGTVLSD